MSSSDEDDSLNTSETRHRSEAREALGDGFYEDTTVRNSVANEVISIARENRIKRQREEEEEADIQYIDLLFQYGRRHAECRFLCPISKLISFTAQFANEDAHELIARIARRDIRDGGMDAVRQIGASGGWYDVCSDKLECHAREIVEMIRVRYAHLRGLTVDMFMYWDSEDSKRILTEFARCVATRWRVSSVVSGTAYKTSKAIDTVRQANIEELGYFRAATIVGNRVVVRDIPTPQDIIRRYKRTRYADGY